MSDTAIATIVEKTADADRVRLYPERPKGYFIIASPEVGADVHVGDKVIYEPFGADFGWFISKAPGCKGTGD